MGMGCKHIQDTKKLQTTYTRERERETGGDKISKSAHFFD